MHRLKSDLSEVAVFRDKPNMSVSVRPAEKSTSKAVSSLKTKQQVKPFSFYKELHTATISKFFATANSKVHFPARVTERDHETQLG